MVTIQNFVYLSGSIALTRSELFAKTDGGSTSTKMSVLALGAKDLRRLRRRG
jgi:hypothetical protein